MLYTKNAIMKRQKRSHAFRKFITVIVYMIVIPLLVYNISLIAQAVINPNKTPSFLGIKTYTIISGSMDPEIKIGDIVIVKEIEKEDLKIGDVISYRQGQSVVTHRIVDIQETEKGCIYKTKGDSNNVEDKTEVIFGLIEGKVIGQIPVLGKISTLLQGKVAIIIIALMVYIYFSHSSKMSHIRNRRKVKRMKYEEENAKEE